GGKEITSMLGGKALFLCPYHNPATTRADRQECLSYKNLNQLPELVTLCSNDFHMLAAVTRQGRVALVQKLQPRLGPGWALVRVRLAGICNTDIEILRGYHNFHGTLGHEFVGEVVRI